ncbi:MAG: HAMP domain-containing histidine kinase, partial [Thermoplasmata archaeon]|nr:HAMP domain-containing histidine kinase [Thermoplasmata archaeon]
FVLHDSSGRIVGVIYPSDPRSGRLPDKEAIETIEIFTSLAEVALENARLSQEREQALRISSQRTEQLSRILDLISGTMYVRNLDQMLENLLKTLARLVGIKRMVIGVKHPELGVYKVEAVYGYTPKAAEAIKRYPYPYASVDSIMELTPTRHPESTVKWRHKVGRLTYYMPAEGQQTISPEEIPYYPDPDLIRLPRPGKGRWHELDWMDTVIVDKDGLPIAYLELLKPRDDRIPDPDTIEIIEIFAGLAGIAIENAKMLQEHIDSRRDAELYTDVLSHDIKNFNQAILGYLELLKQKLDRPDTQGLLNKIAEQVMNTSWLASNVRTMSRVTFGDVDLSRTDLGQVLSECEKNLSQYYPGRKIICNLHLDRAPVIVEADELVREMFINILTNAVKYDSHEKVEIDVIVEKVVVGDRRSWLVSISDRGCGVPDDAKQMIFDRFTKAPTKKGSGMGLHIVKTLATRYGGRVWVEDRVKGDHTQGAVFKVELPMVD